MDVHPGNRAVVHHAIAYVDTGGTARALEAKANDGSPGYPEFGGIGFRPAGMLGGWAPGALARRLPADTGILLPKGADIVLEVHYHKDGKPETDHTQVALYFNQGTVARPMHLFPLANPRLRIPPGDKDYELRASLPVVFDATLLTVFPHMHVLGRRMTVTATLPDGTIKQLIDVPDWDFNWQGFYAFKQPSICPPGPAWTWSPITTTRRTTRATPAAPEARHLGRADDRRDVPVLPRLHRRRRTRPAASENRPLAVKRRESRPFRGNITPSRS